MHAVSAGTERLPGCSMCFLHSVARFFTLDLGFFSGYDPFGGIFGVYRLVDVDLNPVRFWITVQEERDAGGKPAKV